LFSDLNLLIREKLDNGGEQSQFIVLTDPNEKSHLYNFYRDSVFLIICLFVSYNSQKIRKTRTYSCGHSPGLPVCKQTGHRIPLKRKIATNGSKIEKKLAVAVTVSSFLTEMKFTQKSTDY